VNGVQACRALKSLVCLCSIRHSHDRHVSAGICHVAGILIEPELQETWTRTSAGSPDLVESVYMKVYYR
jgi:hypothetical protein